MTETLDSAPMNAVTARTPSITSRLPHVGTTIFTVMSALATQHGASTSARAFPTSTATRRCSTP